MVRTIVMNECMYERNKEKKTTDTVLGTVFVEPASAEIFLTQWKIPLKTGGKWKRRLLFQRGVRF